MFTLQAISKTGQVFKVVGSAEYRKMKDDISPQALAYVRKNKLIDSLRIGREHLVILTPKSLLYDPKNFSRVSK